jgi:hypothetical protein
MKPTNRPSLSQKDMASQPRFAQPHNQPMTEQLIAPPARVWEKIEMILDQQDMNKQLTRLQLSSTGRKARKAFPIYFAAAGASILAGVVWLCR